MAASDHRPTNQHAEVQQLLDRELRTRLSELDGVMTAGLSSLNALLQQRNMKLLVGKPRVPIAE